MARSGRVRHQPGIPVFALPFEMRHLHTVSSVRIFMLTCRRSRPRFRQKVDGVIDGLFHRLVVGDVDGKVDANLNVASTPVSVSFGAQLLWDTPRRSVRRSGTWGVGISRNGKVDAKATAIRSVFSCRSYQRCWNAVLSAAGVGLALLGQKYRQVITKTEQRRPVEGVQVRNILGG